MSDITSRLVLPSLFKTGLFNRSGQAGPRRLVIIAGVGIGMLALIMGVSMIRYRPPAPSQVAKMPSINPLPGGLHSNPQQDALALRTAQEEAQKALDSHQSYTPSMAASQSMQPARIIDDTALAAPVAPLAPGRRQPTVATPAAPIPVPAAHPADPAPIQQISAQPSPPQDPQAQQAYRTAVNQLFQGWDGHAPRTDVVLPPPSAADDPPGGDPSPSEHPVRRAAERALAPVTPASVVSDPVAGDSGRVLVPAGRGIYAHSVLSVNSDTGGPIVLQADSGPIAGDRMIGTFSKNGYDRLVVRVTTVEHQGKAIDANAIVVAPDTMETAVASSVDEHYLERFALPAAAAFVQGLGQAIATTSNTQAVLSPLGGAAYSTHLDLNQQLGVAAGAAAQQVGSALSQEAPKGPTINLAANVNVGVMFLGNLTIPQ